MTSRRSSLEGPAVVAADTNPAMAAIGCAANLPMALPQLLHRLSCDAFVILEAKDAGGGLHNVQPGANIDPDNAMRLAPWGVQFGLTRAEIDALADRLQLLLAKVDAGEQPVF